MYHWPNKSTDLFKEYIKHFFEIKFLCEGLTDELKKLAPGLKGKRQIKAIKAQVREIGRKLCGLELKLDKAFEANTALRFVTKLMLNSLWGRFGMVSDGKQTEFFTEDEADKVFALMRDVNRDVLHYIVCDGPNDTSTICITHRPKEDAADNRAKVNVPLAAMTTGWARLRLFDILWSVTDPFDIVYYDTDSLIAVESALPSLQEYLQNPFMLGQLKSELKPGEKIIKFLCCGPKSYMFVTNQGRVVQHFKGISLCEDVKHALGEEFVEPIVKEHRCGEQSKTLSVAQFQIAKNCSAPGNLQARDIMKTLQSTVHMKRKWLEDHPCTFPYGYDM